MISKVGSAKVMKNLRHTRKNSRYCLARETLLDKKLEQLKKISDFQQEP